MTRQPHSVRFSLILAVAAFGSVVASVNPALAQWDELAKLTASDAAGGDQFGKSVDISGDAAVIGARYDDDTGSAYIFRHNGSSWTQEQKLTASDGAAGDEFGLCAAISGNVAVIGAHPDVYSGAGAAYVFRYNGSAWVEEAKLGGSQGYVDWFGQSVAISGDTVLIGAPLDNQEGTWAGAAYIFRYNGSTWVEEQKITASDGVGYDDFGYSVAISADTAIVGAWGAWNGVGNNTGAAYVFRYNGSTWVEEGKLTASDAAAGDDLSLDEAVAISGDTAMAGAHGHDDAGSDSGAVYVFHFNGSNWVQVQKLLASDAAADDGFGAPLDLSGDTAIIGAYGNDDDGSSSGSAYVFHYNGSTWVEQQKLTASDAAAGDSFGHRVAVSGETVIVGANGNDDNGTDSGSAYVFGSDGSGNQPPVADAGGPYSGTVGEDIQFDASASYDTNGTIETYEWQWFVGDSWHDEGAYPTHAYADPDTYTVTLRVTDDDGATDEATATAVIAPPANQPPVADAGGLYTGNPGTPIQLDGSASYDADGEIVLCEWRLCEECSWHDDMGCTPYITFGSSADYTVWLRVQDDDGAWSDETTARVVVDYGQFLTPPYDSCCHHAKAEIGEAQAEASANCQSGAIAAGTKALLGEGQATAQLYVSYYSDRERLAKVKAELLSVGGKVMYAKNHLRLVNCLSGECPCGEWFVSPMYVERIDLFWDWDTILAACTSVVGMLPGGIGAAGTVLGMIANLGTFSDAQALSSALVRNEYTDSHTIEGIMNLNQGENRIAIQLYSQADGAVVAGGYAVRFGQVSYINIQECEPPECEAPEGQLIIYVFSPVDVVIIDTEGRIISQTDATIPDAEYIETDLDSDGDDDEKYVFIPRALEGDYQVYVEPEEGANSEDVFSIVLSYELETFMLAEDVQVGDIPENGYAFSTGTLCPYLGDSWWPGVIRDVDLYVFTGSQGEEVTIDLFAEDGSADRATLILIDLIHGHHCRLFDMDRSSLPNQVSATLPCDGDYLVMVKEQPRWMPGDPFTGDYCVTMESSGDARWTFEEWDPRPGRGEGGGGRGDSGGKHMGDTGISARPVGPMLVPELVGPVERWDELDVNRDGDVTIEDIKAFVEESTRP